MDYIEAARKILKGNPVNEDLEKLRVGYNKKFNDYYRFLPQKHKKKTSEFSLQMMVASAFVSHENEILKGESGQVNSYYEFHSNPFEFRKRGRKILKDWLDNLPLNGFLEKMKEKEKSQGHYIKNFSYN